MDSTFSLAAIEWVNISFISVMALASSDKGVAPPISEPDEQERGREDPERREVPLSSGVGGRGIDTAIPPGNRVYVCVCVRERVS